LCKTLGKRLFIRVPMPAAMMTTSTAAMTVLWNRRSAPNFARLSALAGSQGEWRRRS
jgi:hypothetical protein